MNQQYSDELICRTNFTCKKFILHTLSALQHVSTHHTWHYQGVFIVCYHNAVKKSIVCQLSQTGHWRALW